MRPCGTGGKLWRSGPTTRRPSKTCLLALAEHGEFGEAAEHARAAMGLTPGHATAHLALALSLSGLGEHEAAESACREAIRLRPELASSHRALARVLRLRGRPLEALEAARESLRLDPADADTHVEAGVSLGCLGRPGEAELRLRYAAWLRPDHADARHNLAVLFVGRRRFAPAVELFRSACACGRNSWKPRWLWHALWPG